MFYLMLLALPFYITADGLVVTNNDTIKGTVQVLFENNQVILRSGNVYRSLNADQIKRVEEVKDGQRQVYVAGTFGENRKAFLFKVLSDGDLKLVYRENIRMDTYEDTVFPPFFMKIGHSFYSLSQKRQLIAAMKDHKVEVLNFIDENDLDIDNEESLVALFDYYNSLR